MTQWALWGTIVNAGAVILGALIGLGLRLLTLQISKKKSGADAVSSETPSPASGLSSAIQRGLGLCVMLIGIMGALDVQNMLVMILSVVLGILVGELLDLDKWVGRLGLLIEGRLKGHGGNVAEAFVTATMLFCVGAMAVTGALESAVLHQHSTYYAKSMLDMVSASIFAFSLGFGVLFSAAAVLAVQGSFTLVAVLAAGAIPAAITGEMIAVGSLLVVAIGLNLLGITKIKVMNCLPAMFFPIALCPLFDLLPI